MSNVTGHLRIEDRKSGRVWVAKYTRAEGVPTRKVIGPAWAKDSGRRTPRGGVIWRAADGVKPEGHLTPKEAQIELQGLLDAERRRGPVSPTRVGGKTFGDAARAYLEYIEQDKGVAATTLRSYEAIVRVHLLPAFGEDTPLRRVTGARVEDFRDRLVRSDLARSSQRHQMQALNGILKRAARRGWISHNPCADVERINVPKDSGAFNVLTPAEVEAVARAAATNWQPVDAGPRKRTRIPDRVAAALTDQREADAAQHAAAIRFAAYTGVRLGELRALRWQDIDITNRTIHVRQNIPTSAPAAARRKAPKSGKVRSVPLSDGALDVVVKLSARPRFTGDDDFVFPSPTGEILDGGCLRDAFYEALRLAGVGHLREKDDPIVFHDLRHTFGTLAVRVAPVTDVQAWMGHADIATTMRYVHYVPRNDAARQLSRAFAVEANPLAADRGQGGEDVATV